MSAERMKSTIPLTDFMFYKAGSSCVPIEGTFELTPMCNFSCRMCYVRKSAEEVRSCGRPMRTLEQWLSLAQEACDAGMLYLLLTGGEPTIWPGFWTLYERLIKMGLLVSINTNGSRLDEEAVQKLIQFPPRRINITLYGANDATYERLCRVKGVFGKVDKAITDLKKAGINVKLNCSLTPDNVQDLEAMVDYARERELILDIAAYMFPPLRRDENMIGRNERFTPEESAYYRLEAYRLQHGKERYLNYLEKIRSGSIPPPGLDEGCTDPVNGQIRCRAGKACFWITWDGWMTPCGMMTAPRVDTYDRSFEKTWKDMTELSSKLRLSGICSKCKNMELCHACAAMAQTETGSVSGIPTYLCEMVQEMKRIANEELVNLC